MQEPMSDLKIKQISNSGSLPNSYIAFNGSKNVWQKIRHTQEFTGSDLDSNLDLLVEHELGFKFVHVTVYDNTSHMVLPSEVFLMDNQTLMVNMAGFAMSGTWTVVVS